MKATVGILFALAAIALVIASILFHREMEDKLPERVTYATQAEAMDAAITDAKPGSRLGLVRGTGSMAPFIPGGRPKEIVAYTMSRPKARFEDVKKGDLCAWGNGDVLILHQAAQKIGDGWKMSGYNNARFDGPLMTAENFGGIVEKIYLWPLD